MAPAIDYGRSGSSDASRFRRTESTFRWLQWSVDATCRGLEALSSHSNLGGLEALSSHSDIEGLEVLSYHSNPGGVEALSSHSNVGGLEALSSHSNPGGLEALSSHSNLGGLEALSIHSNLGGLEALSIHAKPGGLETLSSHSNFGGFGGFKHSIQPWRFGGVELSFQPWRFGGAELSFQPWWNESSSIAPITCMYHDVAPFLLPVTYIVPKIMPTIVQIFIEQGASFRFLFESTCKYAHNMVRRHFKKPFRRTSYLMFRYLFHYKMWRCYILACIHNMHLYIPVVAGMDLRIGSTFKGFQQESARTIEPYGLVDPGDLEMRCVAEWTCLIQQLDYGRCCGCKAKRIMVLTDCEIEWRKWRIDTRIFKICPMPAQLQLETPRPPADIGARTAQHRQRKTAT